MPEVEHNAPGFGYQILWKRDKPGYDWNFEIITDYTKNELVINRQPTYQRYKINVIAFNNKGKSIKPPKQIVGYSGADGKFQIEATESHGKKICGDSNCMLSLKRLYSHCMPILEMIGPICMHLHRARI